MALGKRCGARGDEGLGFGYVRFSRSFGRKRIVISNDMEVDSSLANSMKRHCTENWRFGYEKSVLEALPQDLLIRILCGVEHDDLKGLFHVSKSIREATLIVKQWHFAYTTPCKRLAFRNSVDNDKCSEFNEVEAANAPKQNRVSRSRLTGKLQEEGWPKRVLFMEMEADV